MYYTHTWSASLLLTSRWSTQVSLWKEKLKCCESGWDTWQCLKERVWFLCLFFSFTLPLSLFIDLWEEMYRITHKNKCSQPCISSPRNCITKKKKAMVYVLQRKQCWMIPTADNAQWKRLSRPWPLTPASPQNLGFEKSLQSGIGCVKKANNKMTLLHLISDIAFSEDLIY